MRNQRNPAGYAVIGAGAVLVVLMMIFVSFSNLITDYRFLRQAAPPVTAKIVGEPEPFQTSGKSPSTNYSVKYEFEVNKRTFTGYDIVTIRPKSNTITVYYDRDNPENSRIAPLGTASYWMTLSVGVGILYGGYYILFRYQPEAPSIATAKQRRRNVRKP